MSSYWAAYYGDALVLTGDEFEKFVDKYSEVNGIPRNTIFDDESIREYPFCKSENPSQIFKVTDILKDDCDGMYLIPFIHAGEPNVYKKEEDGSIKTVYTISLRNQDCYAIFAKHDRYGFNAFNNPPYSSYEELKHEFQNLLMDYLPNDFDWNSHIGNFSYACYA